MSLFPLGILSAAGAGGVAGDFELITSTILGSAQSSVVFDVSSFASTYKHLQIRATARKSNTDNSQLIRLNGDTASNYALHYLWGNGSTVQSAGSGGQSSITNFPFAGSNFTANAFGAYVIDILDAYSTTKNKTVRQLSALSNIEIQLASGFWNNTSSLTSISLGTTSGDLVSGSRFSLYGIKG